MDSAAGTQQGIALITAILIAAVVTTAAVAFAASQQLTIRRTDNLLTADRAALGLASLELRARTLLRSDAEQSQSDSLDEPWATAALSAKRDDMLVTGRLGELQGRFNLTNLTSNPSFGVAATTNGAGTGADAPPIAPASNPAQAASGEIAGAASPPAPPVIPVAEPALTGARLAELRFTLLLQHLEIEPGVVQAILDWIDDDSETRFPNGAEDEYYSKQSPPYRAANRPFVSPRELLLVRGMTPEIYAKLAPYVAALPKPTPINVNTASAAVLMSLAPGIDHATVDMLIAARKAQPFMTVDAFVHHPLLLGRPLMQEQLTVSSEYFVLNADVANARVDFHSRMVMARAGQRVSVVQRSRGYLDE